MGSQEFQQLNYLSFGTIKSPIYLRVITFFILFPNSFPVSKEDAGLFGQLKMALLKGLLKFYQSGTQPFTSIDTNSATNIQRQITTFLVMEIANVHLYLKLSPLILNTCKLAMISSQSSKFHSLTSMCTVFYPF